MRNKKWSLFSEAPLKISGILGLSFLSNVPKGLFSAFIYLFIIQLTLPFYTSASLNYALLWKYFAYYCILFVVYVILEILSHTNSFVQSYSISSEQRLSLGDKLKRLSLGFFKKHDPGDVTARLLHDVNKSENILSHVYPDLASAVIVPIVLGIFLAKVNFDLSLILFASLIIAALFIYVAFRLIRYFGKRHIKIITKTSSRILEYVDSLKLLKAYNLTGEHFSTLKKSMKELKRLSCITEVSGAIPVQLFMLILDASYFFLVILSTQFILLKEITMGEYFSYLILGYYFYRPLKVLGVKLVELRYAKISAERIGEIFKAKEPQFVLNEKLAESNEIEFKNVSFSYEKTPVIKNISFKIKERSMTALVGPSGSGKTTLTNLIARFWDIDEGNILIGAKPIKKINPDLLLKKISMVFQDVYLFNDTILNNIKVGNPNASDDEVYLAAQKANCHGFITKFEQGYQTIVGEGGSKVSGGEKQRISIARAILKDAPIIILDEATASLDPENEEEIQLAIENLVKDKTLIVIAHQFNSIVNADQILVLEKGELKQRGVHQDLIQKDGLYKKLWEKQKEARGWKLQK